MQKISISDVGYEPKYYPRVNGHENWLTVLRYSNHLKVDPRRADPTKHSNIAFPPITVVKASPKVWKKKKFPYMLLDGLHRIRAFHSADLTEIYAEVETLPESKWFARSVELNVDSKLPFDTGDLAFIAKRLEADGWSMDAIAKHLLIKVDALQKIYVTRCQKIKITKATKNTVESRASREIGGERFGFLKSPLAKAGLAGTSKGQQALLVQDSVNDSSVISILDSFLAILEGGIVDLSDDAVAGRMAKIAAKIAELSIPEFEPV